MVPESEDKAEEIEAVIGELSSFHDTFGYYASYRKRFQAMNMQKRSDERSKALHKEIANKLRSNPEL
ncbi:Uncharacterized protein dnl_36660 [Desulfonema limicola]|uniref:Uncharacterized protein n=2 Tax=Desulfonema limicola TaxID=45656 RepID=A0A975B983_9BACT|nr:Uncharacterized protein dnl_36660 [Desulfonema limicola]